MTGQNLLSHTVPAPPTVQDQSVFQVGPDLTAVSQKTRWGPKQQQNVNAQFQHDPKTGCHKSLH